MYESIPARLASMLAFWPARSGRGSLSASSVWQNACSTAIPSFPYGEFGPRLSSKAEACYCRTVGLAYRSQSKRVV
jgi:hypothetical protein